jgi:hypothetical protein
MIILKNQIEFALDWQITPQMKKGMEVFKDDIKKDKINVLE